MEKPKDERPKNVMRSTWREDRSQWNLFHWLIHLLRMHPTDLKKDVPVHQKSDPIPYMRERSAHLFIWVHALWPVAIQWTVAKYSGKPWNPFAVFGLYALAMKLNSIHQIWILRRLGHRYGFFDGDKYPRDGVPDAYVFKTLLSLILTTSVRPILAIMMAYRPREPIAFSWWLPVELGLYSVILDGWFYLYHRSCHELDSLWKYHRTHHLTKHPNPLLSSFADSEQEFLELALIPVLSWASVKFVCGFPMPFYDWWICHEYMIFSEAFGHSGVRIFSYNPGTLTWFLKMIDCDLMIEDHDLHHRKGWRKSHNYGKQTRLWDRIFGTVGDRIETVDANLDVNTTFNMPVF